MDDSLSDLHPVACRVLEDWAFLLPTPCAEAPRRLLAEPQRLHATVLFEGGSDGLIEVVTTPRLIVRLLANLLGSEDAAHDGESIRDAVGELVNILGAHILDARWRDRVGIARVPSVRSTGTGEPLGHAPEAEILGLDVDGEPLAVCILSPVPS